MTLKQLKRLIIRKRLDYCGYDLNKSFDYNVLGVVDYDPDSVSEFDFDDFANFDDIDNYINSKNNKKAKSKPISLPENHFELIDIRDDITISNEENIICDIFICNDIRKQRFNYHLLK